MSKEIANSGTCAGNWIENFLNLQTVSFRQITIA